ncbi:MAG: metalloregulator ArsR/SmtB family transcription factor [Euryarchaeota archaeon]|jgi:DNA-binding transcriptional ArsR family regulator|uniref:ArsR/SmtB family transcription factor n=1 Tax=Methanobacterium sp. MZD130B TaxID=3394378 RepID=UPI0017556CA2|nr:metalloregulator ArsR/SmtB family transcription factor [Euryarchaeota archaeon]HHT19654.1 winged helix-turn-helix transcriptional regulator [Methanobacterium sp.]
MRRINSKSTFEATDELEEVLKALANVNRLLLIYSLASGEVEKISVTELSQKMGITQPAASQHLKILKNAEILVAKKEGNYIYYRFNRRSMEKHKKRIDFLFTCALSKCKQLEKQEK